MRQLRSHMRWRDAYGHQPGMRMHLGSAGGQPHGSHTHRRAAHGHPANQHGGHRKPKIASMPALPPPAASEQAVTGLRSDSPPSQMGAAIADRAKLVAGRTGTIGWCYAAVKSVLMPFGIELFGRAAWMAAAQLLKDKRFQVVPGKELCPGDIMVHGKSRSHPDGHIAVYLGNDAEASDHLQRVITGGTYGRTLVFRVKQKPAAPAVRVASSAAPDRQPPKNALPLGAGTAEGTDHTASLILSMHGAIANPAGDREAIAASEADRQTPGSFRI